MKNTEKFAEAYRRLETELRNHGTDYKELEEEADDFRQNRLRICRQMRNYLTHQNDAGFLDISDKQIEFLEKELKERKESGDILKKHLKTVKSSCCTEEDLLTDVFAKMAKLSLFFIPIIEKNGVCGGILSVHELIRAYTGSARPKSTKIKAVSKKTSLKNTYCFSPDTLMEQISHESPYGFIVCTDNGNSDGKVIGILNVN